MNINSDIVKQLISEQFSKWSHLEIKPVQNSGHDNRTFHLGKEMTVRLPSDKGYEPQVQKEARWLPILSRQLSFPITEPIAKGVPNEHYPYEWSINKWISGETVTNSNISSTVLAEELATFLLELENLQVIDGPIAGAHNYYRGGPLSVYDSETKEALTALKDEIDVDKCLIIWEQALSSSWHKQPVWVHGDIAPGNLLVEEGHLKAIIDFGVLGVGDPACDLAMAWTYFDSDSRTIFLEKMNVDNETILRAKGWALWKALITYHSQNEKVRDNAHFTLEAILKDE